MESNCHSSSFGKQGFLPSGKGLLISWMSVKFGRSYYMAKVYFLVSVNCPHISYFILILSIYDSNVLHFFTHSFVESKQDDMLISWKT